MTGMRIGTWNLAGRWSVHHRRLLEEAACDVWLLTEVPAAFDLDGGDLMRSNQMPHTRARSWAAIWSNAPLIASTPVHEAAVLARREDVLFCSCVLPWRSAAATWPDAGANTAARTIVALDRLRPALISGDGQLVWGGDWNHAMIGREYAGSIEGRNAIHALIADAGLRVVTAEQPHALDGLLSIDHIAVPDGWVASCGRIRATVEGKRLSDHDAYTLGVTSR